MKSNRMFGILSILLEKEKITAKELADYFEVSVRTIHRDLLDLSSAGFPVTSQQGIGGGISLLQEFSYNKTVFSKEDMSFIFAGIHGLASVDYNRNIKTLLAKLRYSQGEKMLLENDIIIDFSSWKPNNTTMDKIKNIRIAIAKQQLLEMRYFSESSHHDRSIEPHKLVFKQENWYLFGYCRLKKNFRLFKVNRITDLYISDERFEQRDDYSIPPLNRGFVNNTGMLVKVKMDKCVEFLAIDYFGKENIKKKNDYIYVSFYTEHPDWVISTFVSFGNNAEIVSPDNLRRKMKDFLKQTQKMYET